MPRKKAAQADAVPAFDPYATLDADIDLIAKKVGLTAMSVSEKEDRFDTGNLCLNLMTAGGFLGGGWYTFFGGEQSCKTTLATNVLGSIVRQKNFLGRAFFYDYEGSFSADYADNMWQYNTNGRANNVEHVFGKKDKDGNWIIKPRIQYFAPAVGEDFFDALSQLLKKLPSVMLLDGSYWYIYPNTKANQAMLKGKYDTAYFRKYNKFRIPAPHGLPQAVIVVDSYPSMLPRNQDEKDDGSDGLASQARMFSDGLKRVKGRMREKRVLVFGINQTRAVPMAMHGPKEQEACGNALRYYSDARFRMTSISVPHSGASGPVEEEDSLSGEGVDTYRYIRCFAFKNKLGGPQKYTCDLRLYVSDANGEAKGFDRVWDCYMYLKQTGQISGQRNKIKFGEGTPFAGNVLSWMELKGLVDGEKSMIEAICKKYKLPKPIRLYEWCRTQCMKGNGYELFMAWIKDTKTKKAANAKAKAETDSDDAE